MLGDNLNYINLENPLLGFRKIANVIEFMDMLSEGISPRDLKRYKKEEFLRSTGFPSSRKLLKKNNWRLIGGGEGIHWEDIEKRS